MVEWNQKNSINSRRKRTQKIVIHKEAVNGWKNNNRQKHLKLRKIEY